jgi:hypothetical protein
LYASTYTTLILFGESERKDDEKSIGRDDEQSESPHTTKNGGVSLSSADNTAVYMISDIVARRVESCYY